MPPGAAHGGTAGRGSTPGPPGTYTSGSGGGPPGGRCMPAGRHRAV